MSDARHSRAWRALVEVVVREEPRCWLVLAGCTSRSTTADHVIPYVERPDLGLVRSNLRGACDHCNKARGRRPVAPKSRPRALDIFD